MILPFYKVLHVASILILTGVTGAIFAGVSERSRKLLMGLGGVLSLLVLIAGFGLASSNLGGIRQPNPMHWPAWLWVKVFCWLWLSALGGIAVRRPNEKVVWVGVAILVLVLALVMVFFRPAALA